MGSCLSSPASAQQKEPSVHAQQQWQPAYQQPPSQQAVPVNFSEGAAFGKHINWQAPQDPQQQQQQQQQQPQLQHAPSSNGGPAQGNSLPRRAPGQKPTSPGTPRRGVSFAGSADISGDDNEPTQRKSRPSSGVKRSASFVGADLHNIMDSQGMLHEGVSRQLSCMSHYSVRSESGNVIIEPELPKAPFELIGLIGRGGFGNVYLAEWEGRKVAVKVMQGNCAEVLQPEEQRWEARKERMAQMEAVVMSAIHHPNIVNTFKVTSHSGDDVDADLLLVERRMLAKAGIAHEEGLPSFEWHILMEYCDRGSLSRELASFKLHRPIDNHNVGWDAWASLETLKEMAHALMFLHENHIIHGDLKAANVLLSASDEDRRGWISKISDFGLCRVMNKNGEMITTRTFGTVTHMPSELLAKGQLLPSSDIYAFGICMWEIYTAEKVFKQLSDSAVVLAVVTKKARPVFPPDCPSRYRFLAERCWSDMHELRPSLPKILRELETLQQQLCPQGQDSPPIPCRVFPTRQGMLEQYRQYLASKEEAAQKAKEKAMAQTGGDGPGVRSALKSKDPRKSRTTDGHKSRPTEARFADMNMNSANTREGVKRGVQDYRVADQGVTSHKSMHAKTVGLAAAAAAAADDEEDLEEGPAYNMRMAKSMTARVQKRSTAGPQAGADLAAAESEECCQEPAPYMQQGSLKAKSQSFLSKHPFAGNGAAPEPLEDNYVTSRGQLHQ